MAWIFSLTPDTLLPVYVLVYYFSTILLTSITTQRMCKIDFYPITKTGDISKLSQLLFAHIL